MQLRWKTKCPFCQALIGITIQLDHESELDKFYTWNMFVKPINFLHNQWYYKIIKGKAVKVCSDCWFNFYDFRKHHFIQKRETTGQRYKFNSRALKFEDMDGWLRSMVEYYSRSDTILERPPMFFLYYSWLVFPGLMIM